MLAALVQNMPCANSEYARVTFMTFLCTLPPILPCPNCVKEAPIIFMAEFDKHNVRETYLTLDLNVLMCDIHNGVNRKLHKPEMELAVSLARAVQLRSNVNTKLVWDFLIMSARSIRPATRIMDYKNCIGCLAVLLKLLNHPTLADKAAMIAQQIPASKSQPVYGNQAEMLTFLYKFYEQWHREHSMPCPSEAEFVSKLTYASQGRSKSPLGLGDE